MGLPGNYCDFSQSIQPTANIQEKVTALGRSRPILENIMQATVSLQPRGNDLLQEAVCSEPPHRNQVSQHTTTETAPFKIDRKFGGKCQFAI